MSGSVLSARQIYLLLAVVILTFRSAVSADVYSERIKPLLRSKCYACHGGLKQEAELRLDTASLLREGAEPEELMERIGSEDPDFRMPPEGEPLTNAQVELIRRWLEQGAPGPKDEVAQSDPTKHWAFQPIHRPESPARSGHNPIDAFINAKLVSNQLQATPPATDRTLIRRMFLDLHGLPPHPQQLERWRIRFETAQDKEVEILQLIDNLLASPRYGERWAQHWLDVVRYADTHGFEVNTPRANAWPYRDYVIDSLNQDVPYDDFILDQLAGDQRMRDAATGFMVAAAALLPGQIGKDEASKRLARQDALDEIIVGTTASFLGLTVGCARCHDHKFDPISQSDYYCLQAFFAGVEYGDRKMHDPQQNIKEARVREIDAELLTVRSAIQERAPKASLGRTIVIDDEDLSRVTILRPKRGHGSNPAGTKRGYRDDIGTSSRMPNLSRGRYTWWENAPGADTFTWNPGEAGLFRIWVSWGVHGSGVHTHDARYVLDQDGDLQTRHDQLELASVDQYYHRGIESGSTETAPMWSGLLDSGLHEITEASRIVLRCGQTERGISADVIVLQEPLNPSTDQAHQKKLPILRSPVNAQENTESIAPVLAKYVRWTSLATIDSNKHEPCIDELEVFGPENPNLNLGLSVHGTIATSSGNYSNSGKHQLKHVNDGIYGNSHSWISNEKGRGWVQLELTETQLVDRIQWGRDREQTFKDRLAIDYQIEVSLDGKSWTLVASSQDRMDVAVKQEGATTLARNALQVGQTRLKPLISRVRDLEDERAERLKSQLVYGGKFRAPDPTFVLRRGDSEQPMNEVLPRPPEFLATASHKGFPLESESTDAERRQALARWITSKNNPLTARVMVNRIWQYHFGRGLVETSSDFGLSGANPSHPELLDWLADEFMQSGWSIKSMHRKILSTQAYRRSHRILPSSNEVDAECKYFWRYPSRRLEAEAIRDSMLMISGQLHFTMHGPGFDFFQSRGGLSGFPPVTDFASDQFRRMIYSHKIRMERVPVFGAFDCPDAGQPMPRRSVSVTPIQALNLFNSPFVIDQASRLAERLQAEHPEGANKQIEAAFQQCLGRDPTSQELELCRSVAQEHGLQAIGRVLFNSNEFLQIP